jgi:acetyl-CoA C-acetyltransferase
MSKVAAGNPHAWERTPVSFEDIRDAGEKNRMMALPYTKRHNSDWNVDQAAGLILCSVARARALGLSEEQWVYPLSAAESNHVVAISTRPSLHRSPGAAVAGRRALELAGVRAEEVEHLEIYSCFPAAVQVFARELGLSTDRPLTVTGGMAFAGGPLNNYVLQATVRMAEVLRGDPGSRGLITCVSGFLNKQGFAVWSTRPPAEGFGHADCTSEVAASAEGARLELVDDHEGPVTIASYTVVYQGEGPVEAIAICDLPDGRRTIGVTRNASLMSAMATEEFCGRSGEVAADGNLTLG